MHRAHYLHGWHGAMPLMTLIALGARVSRSTNRSTPGHGDRWTPTTERHRRLAIALSPAGHEFLDRYRDPVNALESRMLHGTTKPRVTALRRTLTTCHANLAPGRPRLP